MAAGIEYQPLLTDTISLLSCYSFSRSLEKWCIVDCSRGWPALVVS